MVMGPLTRRATWVVLAGVHGKRATAAEASPMTLSDSRGTLHGTLLVPPGGGPFPGVLILAGSGPTDRDGNQPGLRNDTLRHLATGLAAHGIASLRIDKRGVGESAAAAPREADLRPETFADDAGRWLAALAARPEVKRVGAIGHSEGGLFATLVARRVPGVPLVLLAAAGRPAGVALREQLAAAPMPTALREAALTILARLEAGEEVADVPPSLAPLFRVSVQPYVRAWLALDPAAELAGINAPVLIAQGGRDLQITRVDAERLGSASHNGKLLEIAQMNHVLRLAPEERDANFALYNRAEVPLAPGLVPAIANFLLDALR